MCPFCPDMALDPLGHHAVTCRHGGDVVIRHNRLRDEIFDLCRHARLSVRLEKGNGLTRDLDHTRPADILIAGWVLYMNFCNNNNDNNNHAIIILLCLCIPCNVMLSLNMSI